MRANVWRWLAWRLPHRLVYWCVIRAVAHATTGEHAHQVVPELLAMDLVRRWENQRS